MKKEQPKLMKVTSTNLALVSRERIIDYSNTQSRQWLEKHIWWAWHNDIVVELDRVDGEES